jgi:hypothetical protein
MTDTTAMIVKTPMMIPRRVRRVLSLLAHRELMAMAMDSPMFIFAIVDPISNQKVSLYRIRKVHGKVFVSG